MSTASSMKLFFGIFFGALALIFAVVAFFDSAEVSQTTVAERQWNLSKLDVIDLVKKREWDVLEEKYQALQQKYESGEAGWIDVSYAFAAFDFADPTLQDAFSNWTQAKPNSFVAHAAKGIYLSTLGFATRGAKSTDKTHPEQIRGMVKFLRMALPDLNKSIELNPNALMAYARLMEIQMFTGDSGGVWQTYIIGYFHTTDATVLTRRMTTALQPKWGGNPLHREMFRKFSLVAGLFDSGFREVENVEEYAAAEAATYDREYETAVVLWTNLLTTNKSADIHLRRAWALRQLDREKEALKDALIAIEIDPDNSEGYEMAADILKRMKPPAKALPYFNAALALNPYTPRSLIGRAYVLMGLNRFEEAVKDLNDTLVFGQWTPLVHLMRAQYLGDRRADPAAAKASYVRLLEFEPDKEEYWRKFLWFLQIRQDCDYFRYIERYLDLCTRNQSCSRKYLDRQRWMAQDARAEGKCDVNIDFARYYRAHFPALTQLDDVAVARLKLGEGRREILAAYPNAPITPMLVDETKKPIFQQMKYGSVEYPPRVVVFLSNDDRIFSIQIIDVIPFNGDIEAVEKTYIEKYGPPDSRHVSPRLELEYRQAANTGKYAKTLTIKFRPLRNKDAKDGSGIPDRIQIITHLVDDIVRKQQLGLN